MSRKKTSVVTFEAALERLESIVEKLESEELGLEDSLAVFEEGIALSRLCSQKLTEVERRIEIVLKDAGPELKTEPFLSEDDDSEGETA